ncbi:MAG: hypothetical protein PHC68_10545 [Syntrophorhabdaceae bacterium]|jgi:hypothetical protein|nr:hypothetical protein [Syntrophorhabdaceae bacterium]
MRWWGWIGIGVVFVSAISYKGHMFVTTASTDVGEGYGLCTIGYALSHLPSAILFLITGLMIWVSARK